jgi:hypothetical protein
MPFGARARNRSTLKTRPFRRTDCAITGTAWSLGSCSRYRGKPIRLMRSSNAYQCESNPVPGPARRALHKLWQYTREEYTFVPISAAFPSALFAPQIERQRRRACALNTSTPMRRDAIPQRSDAAKRWRLARVQSGGIWTREGMIH